MPDTISTQELVNEIQENLTEKVTEEQIKAVLDAFLLWLKATATQKMWWTFQVLRPASLSGDQRHMS